MDTAAVLKREGIPGLRAARHRRGYEEASAIVEVSPKAVATLVRRALQGMIRDFRNIKRSRLKDEVDALEEKVTPEVREAIDAVRSVGNIGAHMEQDINLIIPAEPGEAEKLIGLVEMLVEEWYVARHNRQQRLAELKELGASKEAARKGAPPPKLSESEP